MNLLHKDGYIRPYGGSPQQKEPVDIVCVDGSEGADRAMEFAFRNTPPHHRLLLLNGGHVPHKEEVGWGSFTATSMREGHYWDKDMPAVYSKYTEMCVKEGVCVPSRPM